MEEVFLGLGRGDVQHIAYQMTVQNNLPHNFISNTEMAGDDWLMSFWHRYPELSTPEATSAWIDSTDCTPNWSMPISSNQEMYIMWMKLALPQCKANHRKHLVDAVRTKLDV